MRGGANAVWLLLVPVLAAETPEGDPGGWWQGPLGQADAVRDMAAAGMLRGGQANAS